MKTELILIDIQNDYFPGGKMELEGSVGASLCAKKLLSFYRERKLPVIHIQHINIRPGSTFFLPSTEGVEIHKNVVPLPGETVFQKNFPNIKDLVIAGMMTHLCVDSTTRAAFDCGFKCTVVADACATRSLSFGSSVIPADHVNGAFLAALSPVYATVVHTEDFISDMIHGEP
jgi:nicotinamidase-related amidase